MEIRLNKKGGDKLKFIYVFDSDLKNKIISKGFKLIQEISNKSQPMWVFENIPPTEFDSVDKSKYTVSNVMTF